MDTTAQLTLTTTSMDITEEEPTTTTTSSEADAAPPPCPSWEDAETQEESLEPVLTID